MMKSTQPRATAEICTACSGGNWSNCPEMRRSLAQLGLHNESTISTSSSASTNNDSDLFDFLRTNETDNEAVSVNDKVNS